MRRDQLLTKPCRACGHEKILTDFYKHNHTIDGRANKCKECTLNNIPIKPGLANKKLKIYMIDTAWPIPKITQQI